MEFEILYCRPCGYRTRAEALAAALRERYGAKVAITHGKFGQFDVLLDGTLVASKGRFLKRVLTHGAPPQHELIRAIETHLEVREGDSCELPGSADG